MIGLPATIRLPIARGLALFLALFTLLNIAGSWLTPGFDANLWWIDTGFLPTSVGNTSLLIASLSLLSFGIGFPDHPIFRRFIAIASATLAAVVFWNIVKFYGAWLFGSIHPGIPVPLSLVLSTTLAFICRASLTPWGFTSMGQRVLFGVAFFAAFGLFPLAQMYCFGKTDYRRKADAIVVFGARAYADGTASQALADRVKTGVELYKAKEAPLLILSGGPGDGKASEPEVMRKLAVSAGVPESAIVLDEAGLNTEKTVENTMRLFEEQGVKKVLVVSHFYHLPRVKMTYARLEKGEKARVEVFTVPAVESSTLTALPFYMGREVVAMWVYYLRPLWGG